MLRKFTCLLVVSLVLLIAMDVSASTFSGNGTGGTYSGTVCDNGSGFVTITCQSVPAATNILVYPPGGGYYMTPSGGQFVYTTTQSWSNGTQISFYFVIQNPNQWTSGTHYYTVGSSSCSGSTTTTASSTTTTASSTSTTASSTSTTASSTTTTATSTTTTATSTTTTAAGSWNLVWSDEFNGTGQPDSSNWNYTVGNGYNPGLPGFQGWGNGEWVWYRPDHCYQSGGNLVLKAEWPSETTPQYTVGGLNWYQVSGKITTQGKRSWQYGKIEARIKWPTGQGNWCAFWMMGTSSAGGTYTSSYNPAASYYDYMVNNWASCGEVDIGEHANAQSTGYANCFWDLRTGVYPWTSGQNANYANNNVPYGDLNQFHIFTLEWDATYMKWFVDGVQYHIIDITPATLEEFHKPFYLTFNHTIGGTSLPGGLPGNPVFSVYPQYMYVDYVRVYQK
jgi:beta-glucanase (GH16 family)